jgi:hypothetical protein
LLLNDGLFAFSSTSVKIDCLSTNEIEVAFCC